MKLRYIHKVSNKHSHKVGYKLGSMMLFIALALLILLGIMIVVYAPTVSPAELIFSIGITLIFFIAWGMTYTSFRDDHNE